MSHTVKNARTKRAALDANLSGFLGKLRKGSSLSHEPSITSAWNRRCVYTCPMSQQSRCWLAVRPLEWGGPWAVGCFVCNTFVSELRQCAYARVEVNSLGNMQLQNFLNHATSKSHLHALQLLASQTSNGQACEGGLGGGRGDDVCVCVCVCVCGREGLDGGLHHVGGSSKDGET